MKTTKVASHRRLDDSYKTIIAALLRDVSNTHGVVFNSKSLKQTTQVALRRLSSEGASFLTKTLPRLGKALDKALTGTLPLNCTSLRFTPQKGTKLPKFLGELFNRVLKPDGTVLQDPCPESIRVLRQLTFVYYKYELPYTEEQEQQVISTFERTESDLQRIAPVLKALGHCVNHNEPARQRGQRELSSYYPHEKGRHLRGNVGPCPAGLFDVYSLQRLLHFRRAGYVRDDGRCMRTDLLGPIASIEPAALGLSDQPTYTEASQIGDAKAPSSLFCDSVSHIRSDPFPVGIFSDLARFQYLLRVVREARILLQGVFSSFDPTDIYPRHGPGVVATKQQLWDKYRWTNVSGRITQMYPFDAYFNASLGHVCDNYSRWNNTICNEDLSARVLLVPKDSRGPRLISCEPVDFQWVQQGLGRAIMALVERKALTKCNVFFTDQRNNRRAAQFGSLTGKYATLDLKEASDRISVDLVRLLFPPHICEYLEACRSSSTMLPDGKRLTLLKFAPMGSALCFPVLALTIWSLLTAAATDQDTVDSVLVFGDDVVVPTVFVSTAITVLESFGLQVNRDKSCVQGFFRESCGMDAYKGVDVTPVRFRTVWSSSQSPESYDSWIAYANSFYDRKYYETYWVIAEMLHGLYGRIPSRDQVQYSITSTGDKSWPCPVLAEVPNDRLVTKWRINHNFQRKEWKVRCLKTPTVSYSLDGWSMLLRYFSEKANALNERVARDRANGVDYDPIKFELAMRFGPHGSYASKWDEGDFDPLAPFRVRTYTRRKASILVWRWR